LAKAWQMAVPKPPMAPVTNAVRWVIFSLLLVEFDGSHQYMC
jgi:hypothetical protein